MTGRGLAALLLFGGASLGLFAAAGPVAARDPHFLTGPSSGDPLNLVIAHRTGLWPGDYRLEHRFTNQRTGLTHLVLRQRVRGRDVLNGEIAAAVTRDGEIVSLHDRFAAPAALRAAPVAPGVSARAALDAAAASLALANGSVKPAPTTDANAQRFDFDAPHLSKDRVPVRLHYLRVDEGLALVWSLRLRTRDGRHYFRCLVDATTAVVHACEDWMHRASYRVFAPTLKNPDEGGRTLEVDPADPIASPFGWHDTNGASGAEFSTTRGNSAVAQEDRAGDDDVTVDLTSGGGFLIFDFPVSLANQGASNPDGAVTNAFFWTNWLHDAFYAYGFDEPAGNFQENNYGRGGAQGDPVHTDVQDGAGMNNAQFLSLPDGQPGRMELFFFTSFVAEIQLTSPTFVDFPAAGAEFGPALASVGPTQVVAALDAVEPAGTSRDACSPLSNAGEVLGRIALVDRGNCLFVDKVLNAQAAGAVAVIVANNAGNLLLTMKGDEPTISIPSLFVSGSNGAFIRDALAQGVTATLEASDPDTLRDSAFSNVLIAHEYAHGVTSRLVGGAATVSCLALEQSAGMGEGWSDYFALALTANASETGSTPRGIGTFPFGEPLFGSGFRNYQYSTDMSTNPQTYSDIVDALVETPSGSLVPSAHGIGEIWAAALWEIYWNLVDDYGFDPDLVHGSGGNNLMTRLVMDALSLQPCQPTFLDARDAILMADVVANGGANECAIWQGFAKRGMGVSADDGGSAMVTAVSDGFDTPIECPTPSKTLLLSAVLAAVSALRKTRREPASGWAGSEFRPRARRRGRRRHVVLRVPRQRSHRAEDAPAP